MTPDRLLRETDRCVKCGLCLPHCPTYSKLINEADSPRGRITLVQALLSEELELTAGLQAHLDQCLGCRACERVCPSGVAFGQLIDGARLLIRQSRTARASRLSLWLLNILSKRKWIGKLAGPFTLLRRSHMLSVAEKLAPSRVRELVKIADSLPDRVAQPGLYPTYQPSGKSLQLFIGCVASLADQPAIVAAVELLNRLGYAVEIPRTQACCGALYRHNGFPDLAERLCDSNREITGRSGAEALITLATACHLELVEQNASRLPVISMTDFLLYLFTTGINEFEPLSTRVAIHRPCSAVRDRTIDLLNHIPGLEVFELPDNEQCCGAGGSYLFAQPTLSNAFGQDKVTALTTTQPNIVVTSNTGCAIQLRLQIKQVNLNIDVQHPIELINRQLKIRGFQT